LLLLMVMMLTRCYAVAGKFFHSGAPFAFYKLQLDRRASEAEGQPVLRPLDGPQKVLLKLVPLCGSEQDVCFAIATEAGDKSACPETSSCTGR
jgi:hypothetical protein